MKFEDAVNKVTNITDLRRVARAHVVDHRQLSNDQLGEALIKSKPQYVDSEAVKNSLDTILHKEPREHLRALARVFLVDVLLEQYDTQIPIEETDELTVAFEQSIVDRSNETDLPTMACGDKTTKRYRDLELYQFVLGVAWESQETVSPDEANLLSKLRERLKINETDHRILEAHLKKYPAANNATHTRSDVAEVRKRYQELGILIPVRGEDGVDRDVLPEEIAAIVRRLTGVELRRESYLELLDHKLLRKKPHLIDILEIAGVTFSKYDTLDTLKNRVVADVPASNAIASAAPRFGLSSEDLSELCRDLNLSPGGSMPERVARLIQHYAQLRPRVHAGGDEREIWFRHFRELAFREYDALRQQHLIEKDLEVEHKFEDATRYLFDKMLGHSPLKQAGSNHCDGLLSLKSSYLMWDNKSKETPGVVNLKDHIRQFHDYMENSEKPVPIFLVVAPAFSEDSEVEATRYHAEHFDRNLVLITAEELKALADEWSSRDNSNRDQPFPLGLFAASGRFDRKRLGKLF